MASIGTIGLGVKIKDKESIEHAVKACDQLKSALRGLADALEVSPTSGHPAEHPQSPVNLSFEPSGEPPFGEQPGDTSHK